MAAAALAGAAAGAAPASEPVTVRAGDHGRFGRIVFDWKAPVAYAVKNEGRRLIVEFERPMAAALDPLVRRLSAYVTDAEIEDEGRKAVFTLTKPFTHRAFVNEGSVVIDLLGGGAPPAPGPTAAAAEPEPLAVRVGAHVGFSRIVFDWTRSVDYRIDRDGAAATVAFSHPARLDLARLRAIPPEYVQAVDLAPGDPGLAVKLTLAESARLRHFRSGTKVVVDVLRPAGAPAPAQAAQQDVPRAPPPVPLTRPRRAAKAGAAATSQAGVSQGGTPAAAEKGGQAGDLEAARRGESEAAATLQPQGEPAGAEAPAPAPSPGPVREAGDMAQPAGPALAAADASGMGETPSLAVQAEAKDDTMRLRFGWAEAVAAAAFRRADAVWVAFDRPAPLDLAAARSAAPNLLVEAKQLPAAEATLLRLRVKAGMNPSLMRDGQAWIVELKPQGLQPDTAIAVEAEPLAVAGPRVFLPVADAGWKVRIVDPDVGDTIVVVPVGAAGYGIDGIRQYPEFDLLATAQGIVVVPRADGLLIQTRDSGVEITSAAGMLLSGATPPARGGAGSTARSASQSARPPRGLFDFDAWTGPATADFSALRQALQRAVVEANGQDVNRARLDLARFYFARGFAAEALGLIRTIDREDPQMAADPSYRALRGASHYLAGDYPAAADDLFDPGLDGEPEAMLWRGVLAASRRQWSAAARSFSKVGDTIQFYPHEHKIKFGLLAAETALATGELGAAKIYLDFVEKNRPDQAGKGQAKYLLGWWYEKLGDREDAFAIWNKVATGPDRASEARAKFAMSILRFEDGEISVPEAIERLERLRFAWRGDSFEFDVLHRLGDLYLSTGKYLRGLTTLKRAVTFYPDFDDSRLMAQQMNEVFVELFSEGKADSLQPLKALALYREFRELMPTGELGDEIIRKLAERLVAVDLLGQAGELLDQQVRFRVKGSEKSRLGTRLAMIRLMDKKPELALEALRASSVANIPKELVAERTLLKARALSALNRTRDALTLIEWDPSPAAELVRADIHWRQRDWAAAARALARFVAGQAPDDGVLAEHQANTVLRLAVALLLSGDLAALDDLERRYGAAMEGTPFGPDFHVITAAPAGDLSTVEAIAARIAQVDQFEAFMNGYRERVEGDNVAVAN